MQKFKPLVSCLITVGDNYNYLKDAILSLLNQTYKEIEIVVINDGNHKGVIDIINFINSPKINLFNYKQNGRGKSLNIGIDKSRGDLIAILDSDDIAHKDRVQIQLDYYLKGEKVIFTKFTTDLNFFVENKVKNNPYNFIFIKKRQLIYRNPVCHSSLLIDKKLLTKYYYDESRKNLFDYDLWIKLMIDKHKFILINEILTFKRIHTKQLYENKNRLFYIYSTFILKLKAYKFFKKNLYDFILLIIYTLYSLIPQQIRSILMGKF